MESPQFSLVARAESSLQDNVLWGEGIHGKRLSEAGDWEGRLMAVFRYKAFFEPKEEHATPMSQ
jgi:hypothetical protein